MTPYLPLAIAGIAIGTPGTLQGGPRWAAAVGLIEGSNVALGIRWAWNDRDLIQRHAVQLVEAKPDVLVAQNTPATRRFSG